jgi:hypothetical protein
MRKPAQELSLIPSPAAASALFHAHHHVSHGECSPGRPQQQSQVVHQVMVRPLLLLLLLLLQFC